MKAGWLIGGVVIALLILGWSAWGDVHGWLVDNNAARPASANGYGRATVTFAQVAVTAEIPLTETLQHQGLAGRTHLGERSGMLFHYATPDRYSFWMKGMKIALDFIWIVDNQINTITADVQPPAPGQLTIPVYRADQPVTDILEVRAGFAAEHGLKVGDVVEIQRR